jgi:hypothetical protein
MCMLYISIYMYVLSFCYIFLSVFYLSVISTCLHFLFFCYIYLSVLPIVCTIYQSVLSVSLYYLPACIICLTVCQPVYTQSAHMFLVCMSIFCSSDYRPVFILLCLSLFLYISFCLTVFAFSCPIPSAPLGLFICLVSALSFLSLF